MSHPIDCGHPSSHAEATDQLEAIQTYLDELEAIRVGKQHSHQATADEAMNDTLGQIEELHRQVASTLYFTRKGVQ